MNTKTSFSSKLALIALATALVSSPAIAGGGRGGGGAGGGFGGGGFGPQMSDAGQAANQEIITATADLVTKLTAARTALADAMYAAKLDEADIKAKAAAVAAADLELSLARAKGFDKNRAKFTAEDVTALKAQGARGGGGGFGRGGRGGGGAGGAGGGGRRGGAAQ